MTDTPELVYYDEQEPELVDGKVDALIYWDWCRDRGYVMEVDDD